MRQARKLRTQLSRCIPSSRHSLSVAKGSGTRQRTRCADAKVLAAAAREEARAAQALVAVDPVEEALVEMAA